MGHTTKKRSTYDTFLDVLENVVAHTPQKMAFTYLHNGVPHESITYAELLSESKQLASYMQQQQLDGKRALIMFPSSISYIKTFLACLFAKVTAIPVYPPTLSKNMNRIKKIMQNSSAEFILTTSELYNRISHFDVDVGRHAKWLCLDNLDLPAENFYVQPDIQGDTTAFLQYTSGSTSAPKGVIVTHRNIVCNEEMIQSAFSTSSHSRVLGWLPLYHDMGLIGNVLQPLYLGASCILMDPLDFLQKPIRWLKAISDYKADVSGGPNFAYELCIKKIKNEEVAALDLSSWEVAFNGAEPIVSETLAKFTEKFAPAGFRMKSFYPCYGMAEATLLITGGKRNEEPIIKKFDSVKLREEKQAVEVFDSAHNVNGLVSCGTTQLNQLIAVVDPTTNLECPEGVIGEIWVSGENVAKGYLYNEQPEAFSGIIRNATNRYLKTGDLGFLYQGQLFVTGRKKDVIVLRGKNFFPHDIEQIVESTSPCLCPSACAAFSTIVENEEKLVVVAELERSYRPRKGNVKEGFEPNQLFRTIRKNIVQEFGIQPFEILLIKTGSILKTSSGKIRRSACKEAYEKKAFHIWFSNSQRF